MWLAAPVAFEGVGGEVPGRVTQSVLQTVTNIYDPLQRILLCSSPYTNLEHLGWGHTPAFPLIESFQLDKNPRIIQSNQLPLCWAGAAMKAKRSAAILVRFSTSRNTSCCENTIFWKFPNIKSFQEKDLPVI